MIFKQNCCSRGSGKYLLKNMWVEFKLIDERASYLLEELCPSAKFVCSFCSDNKMSKSFSKCQRQSTILERFYYQLDLQILKLFKILGYLFNLYFSSISALGSCDQYRTCYHILCVFKSCPLDTNYNNGFKKQHLKSCSSTM